jgi:hypothetical protein
VVFITDNMIFFEQPYTYTCIFCDVNIIVECINKLAAAQLNNIRINQRRLHLMVVALMLFANWYIPTKECFQLDAVQKGTDEISHVYTEAS